MLSEFALSRKNQMNAVGTIKKIAPKSKWHFTCFLAVSTAFITLPAVFKSMPFSGFFELLFFVLIGIAAILHHFV